jgi:cell wall-associated NlpC family hydrolase
MTDAHQKDKEFVEALVNFSEGQYVWGGEKLRIDADCSGFVYLVMNLLGKSMPRLDTYAMYHGLDSYDSPVDGICVVVTRKHDSGHCGILMPDGYVIDMSRNPHRDKPIARMPFQDWRSWLESLGYPDIRYYHPQL